MKYTLELTRSQHMALIDLIAHTLRCRCDSRIEEFVDVSQSPTVTTTPGELLRVVSEAKATGTVVTVREWGKRETR